MAFGRPKKSRTVNSSVEPSYTLSGLRSTDEIHDAEKHQSNFLYFYSIRLLLESRVGLEKHVSTMNALVIT